MQEEQVPVNRAPSAPENPFDGDVYFDNNQQDHPIAINQPNMIRELLEDDNIDTSIKKKWYWVFNKDNILTFLDTERRNSKLNNFDISKIDEMNATPYMGYTFEKEAEYNVIRNMFETKIDRATGIKNAAGIKNERIIQQSQFNEVRNISEENNDRQRDGFMKRLLGRR